MTKRNTTTTQRAGAILAVVMTACTPAKEPASTQGSSTATTAAAASTAATTNAKPCAEAEHRQMDFWVGEWTLALRARTSIDSNDWTDANGTNRITSTLHDCVIEERFEADGPGPAWAGHSVSQLVASDGKWHQTWVDDQGGYITLVGTKEGADIVLVAPPRIIASGATQQMRMVYTDIKPDSLTWRWEGTRDAGKTWQPTLVIAYTRARRAH